MSRVSGSSFVVLDATVRVYMTPFRVSYREVGCRNFKFNDESCLGEISDRYGSTITKFGSLPLKWNWDSSLQWTGRKIVSTLTQISTSRSISQRGETHARNISPVIGLIPNRRVTHFPRRLWKLTLVFYFILSMLVHWHLQAISFFHKLSVQFYSYCSSGGSLHSVSQSCTTLPISKANGPQNVARTLW